MPKYAKFAALIAIILATLIWLAFANTGDSKTYYKTIAELGQMGDHAYGQRVRVGGDVQAGSIQHHGGETVFTLTQDSRTLKVAYAGIDPLPDTFRDGAQALADGKLDRDGTFHAARIQAKCASKYEAKPGSLPAGKVPVNPGKSSI